MPYDVHDPVVPPGGLGERAGSVGLGLKGMRGETQRAPVGEKRWSFPEMRAQCTVYRPSQALDGEMGQQAGSNGPRQKD